MRHDRRLLLDGHRENAGCPGADRDEADVAERQHAGVANKDIEGDDDRDVDERIDHVRLGRARDQDADERRYSDHGHRREQLHESMHPAHRRSAAESLPRANNPPGRNSRTTITPAKRNDGRYWL